ncbi:signal peptidase I [Tessaracoccus sp. OS52]|uniref:signal peptidase I n=1 Tax=Tessaracoccus sp. OS52 TaxID=2886691 RepID=UPI001D108D6D|nr:signal peptidase I [Tessaracoccus sp. OS52]MCC2594704.1 signal peptidase I [Tessaracoccus sp. OS52]
MLQGKRNSPSGTPTKTLRAVGQAVSLVLLAASVLAALVLIVVPFATGSQTYTVLTSSMAPRYSPGTFIVVKPAEFSTLEVGDVVTYQIESGKPAVITHRITGFSTDQEGNRLLITKGDNNDATDPEPVQEVQVRGKLLYAVPYAGFLANALGQTNRSMTVNLLAAALIAYGLFLVGHGAAGRKTKAVKE